MLDNGRWGMMQQDAERMIECLQTRGVGFDAGLSDEEVQNIERTFKFVFPPDLKLLLQIALPVSERFPDWRSGVGVQSMMDWLVEGIMFDVEYNNFWLEEWGQKPDSLGQRVLTVRSLAKKWPRLIPVYGHRYLPAFPSEAGNPVYSVYQTDIICYGNDLLTYLCREFKIAPYRSSFQRSKPKQIPFWGDLAL